MESENITTQREDLQNRYDNPLLQEHYAEIVACLPEYPPLRQRVAEEIRAAYRSGKILDIGAGGGESAKPVLDAVPGVAIDLLDVSQEMRQQGEQFLSEHQGRYRFVQEDALEYLKRCEMYDIMFSEFTVHNFDQESKQRLFMAIRAKLRPGGMFVLLDKIVSDDVKKRKELHDMQMERYRQQLQPNVANAIIEHENEDMQDDFRMSEGATVQMLKDAGFSSVEVLFRLKRDAIVKAIV